MCTVSIIKDPNGKIILTSNRDEKIQRVTRAPQKVQVGDQFVTFPQDAQKGGTWIALGSGGIVACLLNGGFENHESKSVYAKSRGQVVLDVYRHASIEAFIEKVELSDVEPFTLILFCAITKSTIHEVVWDGRTKHVSNYGFSTPRIWSSSTLYSSEIKLKRSLFFNQWLGGVRQPDSLGIRGLHTAEPRNGGFILNGEENLRTVSISQIEMDDNMGSFYYKDLLNSEITLIRQKWQKTLQLH